MAILIDEKKRVLVQGITGREGRARTRLMREYGTNVVGGVTPGKGGQSVLGVPVFNTPQEAVNSLGNIDVSVVFVPAAGVKDAAISAIEAGIKLAVLVPDRVPVWDAMEIAAAAKANNAMFLGPNTLGALSPGKAVVGMNYTSAAGPASALPKAKAFVDEFKKKFSKNPEPYAAEAYDAATIAVKAIEEAAKKGKVSREDVATAVRKAKLSGITGDIAFDAKGDRLKAQYFVLTVVSDDPGKWGDNKIVKQLTIAPPAAKK